MPAQRDAARRGATRLRATPTRDAAKLDAGVRSTRCRRCRRCPRPRAVAACTGTASAEPWRSAAWPTGVRSATPRDPGARVSALPSPRLAPPHPSRPGPFSTSLTVQRTPRSAADVDAALNKSQPTSHREKSQPGSAPVELSGRRERARARVLPRPALAPAPWPPARCCRQQWLGRGRDAATPSATPLTPRAQPSLRPARPYLLYCRVALVSELPGDPHFISFVPLFGM